MMKKNYLVKLQHNTEISDKNNTFFYIKFETIYELVNTIDKTTRM